MSTQLKEQGQSIETIRSQLLAGVSGLVVSAKRVYRLRAALLWIAAAFIALLVLVSLDMLLRREELGLRLLFLATWTTAAIVAAYFLLRPALRFTPSKVELARWIESAQPELGEQLSTAVELAESGPLDNRLGSQQFRDAAIRLWSQGGTSANWKSYLDHSGWLRACGVMLAAIVIASAMFAWRPYDVSLAAARLFRPWSELPWPLNDQLEFVNAPRVIANGQELNLEIIDAVPPLPESIVLQVRYPDSDTPQNWISYPAKNLTDVAVGSIPSVDQAIEVRAVGGDDRKMAWHRVGVAHPPKLESYRFHIQPPLYSGRPPSDIVGNRIQAPVGSRIQFIGRFAEPVSKVELAMQSKSDGSSSGQSANLSDAANMQATQNVTLNSNNRDFECLISDASTPVGVQSWRWKLTTQVEFSIESPELWSVELTADAVPAVTLAEQEMSQLSPDAALLIRGKANDDLGLADVSLRWQIEGAEATEPGRYSLWPASDGENEDRIEFAIERTWQFDSSVGLLAGQRLLLWMEARDTLGQLGKSSTQSLEVRSAEDVLELIAARQSQLLEQIREITEAQRRNSQLAARSREIVEQAETVRREEVDALANVAQMQQSVNRQLSADRNSVADNLRSLSTLLENNQLANSEMAVQLKVMEAQIEKIGQDKMSSALRNAQAAREQARIASETNAKPSKQLTEALTASESSQAEALSELQGLTDRLAQSEALRVVERELGQVLSQQQSIRRDTDSLEIRRLAGLNKEDFQSNRAGLQADQQGLAQSVDQLQRRAKALAESMPQDQATLKVKVEQALKRIMEDQVSGQMRSATESIASDRFAQATDTQAKVIDSLRKALQKLHSSSARTLESQLGQLQSTASELRELANEQADLARRMSAPEAASQVAGLSAEQKRLQQQTEEQQARSNQTGDSQTEQSLEAASQAQEAASEAAQSGQTSDAARQASTAAKELANAANESTERAKELEREVASQQLMQLSAALSQLVAQQSPIVAKLNESSQVQLDVLDEEDRHAAEKQIRQLASRQEAVRQIVRDVRERADKLPAFDWTLEQAELDMARAVAAAQRFRITPDATDSATRALRKLEQAAAALMRPEQARPEENQQDNQSQANQDESKKRPVPPLASLKLLRGLQADVNEETKQLSEASSIIGAVRTQRLEQLSQQQQALGLQLEQILRELAASMDSNQ